MVLFLAAVLSLAAAPVHGPLPQAKTYPVATDVGEELRLLRERVATLELQQSAPPAPEPEDGVIPAAFCWPQVGRSSNRYPTLHWSGFIQLDTGWVSQSQRNIEALGDIESKTGLRRVRLRAGGHMREDVSYVVDLDFAASGHPSFRDVKATLHDQGWLQNIQVGYYQQPMGFDAMTSGRELLLLERQLPFAFVPFRQTGLGAYGTLHDEDITWALSGFRSPTDSFGVSEGDAGGWGYANRVTVIPYYNEEKQKLVHLGGSYSFINPGTDVVRYAIEPGFFVVDPTDQANADIVPAFVDTGRLPAENVNLAGIELGTQWGSFNAQAEAIGAFVDQEGGPFTSFYGVSAKLAYVLTGETHPYDRERAVFTRVVPRTDGTLANPFTGAWEAVAAWSLIDLNDKGVDGGRGQTVIVGLNRYLDRHTKFQFNVIRALLDDSKVGRSATTYVALRIQAEF